MALSVTAYDFNVFLKQFKTIYPIIKDLSTIDMTGVLTDTYYSDTYDNGNPLVTIPLIKACHDCDIATYTYQLTEFKAKLAAVFTAFEDYFANYYENTEINSVNEFMLSEGIFVSDLINAYYYLVTGKRFYAGNVYKSYYVGGKGPLHYTYTNTAGTWAGTYGTTSFTGTTYNLKDMTGNVTRPEKMIVYSSAITPVLEAYAKFTFLTATGTYIITKLLTFAGTEEFTTDVPVVKLSSIEIVNGLTNDTRNQDLTGYTITAYYTSPLASVGDATLTVVDASGLYSSTPEGYTEAVGSNYDIKTLNENGWFLGIQAVPSDGYEFVSWDVNDLVENPRFIAYENWSVPVIGSPIFQKLNQVNIAYTLDGVAYFGSALTSNLTSGSYYKGTIAPLFTFNSSLYSIPVDGILYQDEVDPTIYTIDNGDSILLNEDNGTYTITVNALSIANITFTTTPLEGTLTDYTVKFLPDVWNAEAPALFKGDSAIISARLIAGISPTDVIVFKKWSGESDYSALQTKTLAASNSYTAEVQNLGASPTTAKIMFGFSGTGTATWKDLNTLNSSDEATDLTAYIGEYFEYPVYVGSSKSFELIATGSSVVWTLDEGTVNETVISTDLTVQLDLPNILTDHSITCVVTA